MQPKGDGEWPYSAPFTGLNASLPSILLPPTAQDVQTSPSFSIVRGSIAAPWPFSYTLFGNTLGAGEYFIFATAAGFVVTNLNIYQMISSGTPANAWNLFVQSAMPAGAYPPIGSRNNNPVPFLELNGCLYFACLLGIYRYAPSNGITLWGNVDASTNLGLAALTATYMTVFGQRLVVVGTTGTPTTPGSPPIPLNAWTIAWTTVSDFSDTSVGSFNVNPSVDAGNIGGFDVLTSYSQGVPSGLMNIGHSFYIHMTQGVVECDPAASGVAPFTLYNYWQERVPVGSMIGSVAQYGEFGAAVTPDNVYLWSPGGNTPIGGAIMPYLRSIFRNLSVQAVSTIWPRTLNPAINASFYTIYNELHYCLTFNAFGIPPQQATPPYPAQATVPVWFGMLLDYNFATQAWTQQVTPPLTGKLYQVIGPPLISDVYSQIPSQNLLITGTMPSPSATAANYFVIAPDVFNQVVYAGAQCQGLASQPQPCQVGFPQTPIAAGHRPAARRVRIEYSWDEESLATAGTPVNLTITMQGTITQNTGATNGNGVASTTIQSISKTIQVNPPGIVATTGNIQPCLTATAYADMVLSVENPQVSLSWTDPSADQRLLIHRVTAMVNDTKGTMQ
jgi:hypothetical protein